MTTRAKWISALPLLLFTQSGCHDRPAAAAGATTTAAAAVSPRLGTFETDLKSDGGSRWHAIDDSGAGGASTAKVERVEGGAAETHMALHVIGNAKLKDFPFPFAGTRVALGRLVNGEPTIVDISKYSGIEFWAKGNGKPYLLRVLSDAVKDYNYHYFTFTAQSGWTKYRVPFSSLRQFEWGEKQAWTGKDSTALMVTNYTAPGEEAGAIDFYLDEVTLYR